MRHGRLPSAVRRLLGGALVACSVVGAAGDSRADPIKIHVRGSAQIQAGAWMQGDALVVRGDVVDDAGASIVAAPIAIQLLADGGAAVPLPTPAPCDARIGGRGLKQSSPTEYTADTDEIGSFCVRAERVSGISVRVRFASSKSYEGAEATVRVLPDEALPRTLLRFEPPLEAIDLDRDSVPATASLRIERSPNMRATSETTRREGLTLVLQDERGETIARETTGGDGKARFVIRSETLAAPGPGELRLRFDGAPGLASSSAVEPIVRRAFVNLALAHEIDPGNPEEGVAIDVDVTSSRGAVSGGVVEALRAGESVGAATVERGRARVIATFTAERAGSVALTLRYVAASPWWRPRSELPVQIRVAGPGVGRQIVLAAIVLAIAAWVIGGWRRAPKLVSANDAGTTGPPSGRAGVQILASPAGIVGWRGSVTDAHDGTPVASARLRIVVPSFQGDGTLITVTTDGRGVFALDPPDGLPRAPGAGVRLIVESTSHSTYEQALPPPSVLGVALVTRRRTLLDRLVRWARKQGAPFDAPPEATPGHVRRAAARASADGIEAWARRVEQAAFGPEPVDESVERDVRAEEPRGGT